ncbi:MAG: hypothetical protein U0R71_13135 [Solirubrobacterales bacterium]
MARRDPVHGVGVVRYPDTDQGQLVTKSYRPGAGCRRGLVERCDPLGQLLGPADQGPPEPRPVGGVERGEDLAAKPIEHRQPLPLGADAAAERVEGADPGRRQPGGARQAAGGRDPDPQAGERARPEADGDQVDAAPAARRRGRRLDLGEQRGRVARPAAGREAELGLVQDLAVAPGAGGGVDGRGVEADDYQRGSAPRVRVLRT